MMKIIYDIDSASEFVVEESINEATGTTSKKYKIKGIFSTIGEKNRNGRIYPRHLWETEISKYQENFSNGSINTLMEWEHPARTHVDPMEAIAKITSLSIKDKYVMGEAVLLDNEKANQIKTLIDNGVKISVSSRGVGSVKNGIVESFRLTTYDLVATPSDYNATMNGLVESYKLNEGIIEDMNFILDENDNLVQVCSDNACHMFEKEEIQNAIESKFSGILSILSEGKIGKISGNDKYIIDSFGEKFSESLKSLNEGPVTINKVDKLLSDAQKIIDNAVKISFKDERALSEKIGRLSIEIDKIREKL